MTDLSDSLFIEPEALRTPTDLTSTESLFEVTQGKNNLPMTASVMLNILKTRGVKTGELCSAFEISSNRLLTLTKKAPDGRDMAYEFIPPIWEMFIRIVDAYPEYAPWKRVSPKELMDVTGWDMEDLAFVCTTSVSAVKRWLGATENKMTAQTSQLINLIYRMVEGGVHPDEIVKISRSIRKYRNEHPISAFTDDTWNSFADQTYRKIRKILRSAIQSLRLDGKKSLSDARVTKIVNELISEKTHIDSYMSIADADDLIKTHCTNVVNLCLNWLTVRDEYQRVSVELINATDETELKSELELLTDKLNSITDEIENRVEHSIERYY